VRGRGRALRIKQFLYDWAPPAAGIAPLWKSARLVPFDCGPATAWLGTDYRKAPGACVQLERTQVEVSVLEGVFEDREIADLLRSLRVADPRGADPVRHAPFHLLDYWVRYRLASYRVPHGLWRYPPATRPYGRGRMAPVEEVVGAGLPVLLPPGGSPFLLDSCLLAGEAGDDPAEAEWRLRHREDPGRTVWFAVTPAEAARAFPLPPEPEPQAAELRERRTLRGRPVFVAALTLRNGAWESWWEEEGHRVACWTVPSPGWSEGEFAAFVEGLVLG
jgi:hypothetical protein